jgi:hypothetical protein
LGFFDLYADSLKSITIKEIGECDVEWDSVIINTHTMKQGLHLDGSRFFYCYAVDEFTFDEIIDFINNNRAIFGKRPPYDEFLGEYLGGPYGSVELFIENEGMEYYFYSVERRSSAMFFFGLLELLINRGNYDEIVTELERSIRYFGFDKSDIF